MAVRRACVADSDALASVHVRAWQVAYVGLIDQDYLDSLDPVARTVTWRAGLSDPSRASEVLVGTAGDVVVGFAAFGPARDEDSGDGGELYALNVDPDRWGTGVGSALLRAAEAGLAGRGFRDAVLWVVPGNVRARRFYERHGWSPERRERVRSIQGVAVPEVRYARPLAPDEGLRDGG